MSCQIGPAHEGRTLTVEEFAAAEYEPCWRYELIDGRLATSPRPEIPEWAVEEHVHDTLRQYQWARPDVIPVVGAKARVVLPGPTSLEPDVTVFREDPRRVLRWADTRPWIVVEVLTASHRDLDDVVKRQCYLRVPSIEECWHVDPIANPERPGMVALVREPGGWSERAVAPGGTYTTDRLPGFVLDLSRVPED